MQRLVILLVCSLLCIPLMVAQAQDNDPIPLAYGDEATGTVTNRDFERLFTFEGEADDVVMIRMIKMDINSDLDPYLYLTTLENAILSQADDDFYSLNAMIIAKLPATATYQIVATRPGGRGGYGSGAFSLSLTKVSGVPLGVVMEGQVANTYERGDFQIFMPATTGFYTLTYKQVRGAFYPGLTVLRLSNDEYSYNETLGQYGGHRMRDLTLTMEFEEGRIYLLAVGQSYYSYYDYNTPADATALYTLQIAAADTD